ncbi:MAG: alpha-glucosidase [Corynebacterium sp.]|nr:alpha-glucosidase [Corynebacterium sp.]
MSTNPLNQWWSNAVVYQIYPRSFQDSNGDGIGDLQGVIQRLDYLATLGVDIIWLSPVYQSPNDDNGYDISNYREIMSEFGNLADMEELLSQAHARDIKIMMDLVVNHSSDEHYWFQQSRSSKDNPYRDYYIWKDPQGFDSEGQPIPPNNWISAFSPSAWEWDAHTEQFYLHMFSVKQPDLNWENPQVRAEVYAIMRFWLDRGVDGFRMDVINLLSKPIDFHDDPAVLAGSHESSIAFLVNGPRMHEFLQEMRREVLDHYQATVADTADACIVTVGETPDVSAADAIAYTGYDRGELSMVFQFEHMLLDGHPAGYGKWSPRRVHLPDLKANLSTWQEALYNKGWNSLYWDNHDQPRAVSRFGDDSPEYRVVSAKMLASVLHGLQGTPYIYQGEELGMTNVRFATLEEYDDIESHDGYAKYVGAGLLTHEEMMDGIAAKGRDNARTPMQWSNEPNAGFSTKQPWLQVNPNYPEINAAEAVANSDSVFHHYRKLIALRHDPALRDVLVQGRYELLDPSDEQVWAYVRHGEDRKLVVLANFTAEPVTRDYSGLGQQWELLLSNYADAAPGQLRAYEAQWFLVS